MYDHQRVQDVRRLLFEYLRSPSLRHLRAPHSVDSLTQQIIQVVDQQPTVWRKWLGERDALLRAAAETWVPMEELRAFLNSLPGPKLTATDVAQRLRALQAEGACDFPDDDLRDGCLQLYAGEVAAGTEFPAIIGALKEYVEDARERLRREADASRRQQVVQEKAALEARFFSGADCKWVSIGGSRALYTRKNGRAYRLAPTKDKRWDLFRISDIEDPGVRLGTYGTRGDAAKVLARLAYEPEPRW